jgi:hypothetical protein
MICIHANKQQVENGHGHHHQNMRSALEFGPAGLAQRADPEEHPKRYVCMYVCAYVCMYVYVLIFAA